MMISNQGVRKSQHSKHYHISLYVFVDEHDDFKPGRTDISASRQNTTTFLFIFLLTGMMISIKT